MNSTIVFAQLLNGLQYGVLLFLLAAGLTLVLGIMNFVNLAHASLYMLGAYLGAAAFARTDSFLLAGVAAVLGTLVIGLVVERTTLLAFYAREHPAHGGGARRQHPAPEQRALRPQRRARRAVGPDGGADPRGAAGHGRQRADRGAGGDRDRRHRLDPRRVLRRADRGDRRYGR